MNKKKLIVLIVATIIVVLASTAIYVELTKKVASPMANKPTVEEFIVIPKQPEIVNKLGVDLTLDSTKRLPGKFIDGPLKLPELDAIDNKYVVEISNIPECGGSMLSNSYTKKISNKQFDHVIASVPHSEPYESTLQNKLNALRKQDKECGYISQTTENQASINEMLEEYKKTFETDDLVKIENAIKQID